MFGECSGAEVTPGHAAVRWDAAAVGSGGGGGERGGGSNASNALAGTGAHDGSSSNTAGGTPRVFVYRIGHGQQYELALAQVGTKVATCCRASTCVGFSFSLSLSLFLFLCLCVCVCVCFALSFSLHISSRTHTLTQHYYPCICVCFPLYLSLCFCSCHFNIDGCISHYDCI